MNLKQQRQALLDEAKSIAEKAAGNFTEEQAERLEQIAEGVKGLNAQERAKGAEDVLEFFNRSEPVDGPATSTKAAGRVWAKAVTDKLKEAAGAQGLKALLQGQIDVPPTVAVVTLPDTPTTLVDLVQRRGLDQHGWSYLRQIARDLNAAPVADGATKPTSTMTFEEVEDRARVIAHLSEPFPIRYASDYRSMMQVIESQMAQGLVEAIEDLIVNGDGTDEAWEGILHVEGTTDVAFAGDPITTLRRARTMLESKGEAVTGVAMHPNDIEALDMTREDGSTGGFLLDGDAYRRIFGSAGAPVPSLAVPEGTAIVGDWGTTGLLVREEGHTLASTQSGDLFDTNQMKLRTEGRYGFEILRPQALAVVELAEAPVGG